MKYGDTIRIEMKGHDGEPFGAIDQTRDSGWLIALRRPARARVVQTHAA